MLFIFHFKCVEGLFYAQSILQKEVVLWLWYNHEVNINLLLC